MHRSNGNQTTAQTDIGAYTRVYRAHEAPELPFVGDGRTVRDVHFQKRPTQGEGRVGRRAKRNDCVAEDAPYDAAKPAGRFPPTALFDALEEDQDFSRDDLSYRPIGQRQGQVLKQPAVLAHGAFGDTIRFHVCQVFGGDSTERILGRGGRGDLVELPFDRRVRAFRKKLSGVVAFRPCGRKRNRRKGAKGQHILAAAEAITEPPQPAAIGLHQKMQAEAVGEHQRLVVSRNGVDDRELGKRHESRTLWLKILYSNLLSF
jgi:hypothetical protein